MVYHTFPGRPRSSVYALFEFPGMAVTVGRSVVQGLEGRIRQKHPSTSSLWRGH
ncbi:hypothetical protein BO86DRAFT_390186 [Aspergillus japonicus CBS 114.51]|uniref:Uncharacterized protein n=1 Tax=Aspergillus japonicus CBS 114.51 TaxID=1448312 RepID=A0A8T8WXN3_ASPJA|nr:hypothetical protein BO86DRAFT_390186 [Aspergillus japonicus CBS 114.51]RAH80593.1 hypothetical protein BO86DRAFT_390186 [Aspergillus japonicus CBS 114.51]